MSEPKYFDNFQDAFSVCREKGHPIMVVIRRETWRLFPSGRAEQKTGYFKTDDGGCKLVKISSQLKEFPFRVHLAVKCSLAGDHPHAGAHGSQTLALKPDMSDPSELHAGEKVNAN